jgi:hypothetical protein
MRMLLNNRETTRKELRRPNADGSEKTSQQRREKMSLISLIVTLAIVGVILWAVNTYIPMEGRIKQLLNVVVLIAVVLWLLNAFGVLAGGPHVSAGGRSPTTSSPG